VLIAGGPRNWEAERGQAEDGPLIEQVGNGVTVKTTSLVSVQPLVSTAVNRRVAEAEKTCAVMVKEFVELRMAVPVNTVQLVEAIG